MKPRPSQPPQRETPVATSTQATQQTRPPKRRFWFRIVAAILPLVLLGALEAGLRLGGYGYPTSFFLADSQNGERLFTENPKFGWRFFPPSIARAPQPLMLQVRKLAGTVRIFLFGESAAMGDPDPAYGFGRQLERILRARHPGRQVEVVNVAMTAINSHVIREIARDCRPCEGDIWLVYAGNNEVVGPFGAGSVFGPQAPRASAVRLALAAKSSRIGQLIASFRPVSHEPTEWQGMEFFLHNQVSINDPRLPRVYRNFSENLSAVIRYGQKAGAKILVATVPVNQKDCPPFASSHKADINPEALAKWEQLATTAQRAEKDQHFQQALTTYKEAELIDPGYAELSFRKAICELALSQTNTAQRDFSRARDLDALRFRIDSNLSHIIQETATINRAALVDLEKEMALHCPGGVPGEEHFYDHVHLNFSGNYLVATLLAAEIERLLPSLSGTGPVLQELEVARQLAFTDFDRHRIGQEMRERERQPPFSAQSNFQQRDLRWQQLLGTSSPAPSDSVWEYRGALTLAPDDWEIRQNFARLLQAAGKNAEAAEQWSQVIESLPHEPEGYFQLGNLAYDKGAFDAAADYFRQALQRRPNSAEILNGLGLVLAAQGKTNEAMARFQSALQLNPAYGAARVNTGMLLANRGEISNAISEYNTVLRLDTNNIAARINLAKILASQGKKQEAVTLYTQALELKPDNPVAQFDLGNALAADGKHDEALTHYAAAVQYEPGFADAQYNLAVELARTGNIAQALTHFAEAVRLRPASAEAHFNYGIALAKVKRYSEAANQFQETLKLQPNHPSAQAMLSRAQQLDSGGLP
jgi:tetratricopeptide (TPR) repeat protein